MNINKSIETEKIIEVGKILRNRRVEIQLSVIDLSTELNLNYNYINLIEKGEININDNVFYFGYVSSMSKFMGLNDRDILSYLHSTFRKDSDFIDNSPKDNSSRDVYSYIKNNRNEKFKYKTQAIIIAIIVLFAIIIYNIIFKI